VKIVLRKQPLDQAKPTGVVLLEKGGRKELKKQKEHLPRIFRNGMA